MPPVADIQEMTFDVVEEQVDTTMLHSFTGYILVSTKYFQNSYYGNKATLGVYRTSKGELIVTFSDPTWGDALFGNVQMGQQLSGEGIILMPDQHSGTVKEYEATISGPMTAPVISIPTVMGGTEITFHVGTAPECYQIAGSHQGDVSVMVGGQFGPYDKQGVTYKIKANADGTINVEIPAYDLPGTVMGDLSLGTYTVSNIAYDEERGAFYRDYSNDGLTFHLTAVNNGETTMDNDYSFTQLGNIEVKRTETGVTIINNFQPGAMPFPVVATFVE